MKELLKRIHGRDFAFFIHFNMSKRKLDLT